MVMLLVPPKRDTPTAAAQQMGAKLKALRESKNKTQRDVGEALNLSFKTVSAYENGRAILGSDDFPKWAEALDVSVAELTAALGLGVPMSAGRLRSELSALYGPDAGERLERDLLYLVDLPKSDQEHILDSLSDQIAGRHARRQHSD